MEAETFICPKCFLFRARGPKPREGVIQRNDRQKKSPPSFEVFSWVIRSSHNNLGPSVRLGKDIIMLLSIFMLWDDDFSECPLHPSLAHPMSASSELCLETQPHSCKNPKILDPKPEKKSMSLKSDFRGLPKSNPKSDPKSDFITAKRPFVHNSVCSQFLVSLFAIFGECSRFCLRSF